jgi:heat shock protein HslJ
VRTRLAITALAVAAIVVAACSTSSGGSSGGTGGTLEGVEWSLRSYVTDGATKDVPAEVFVDANFDAGASEVTGSAGCNRYFGPYTASGPELTFGDLGTTMMACVGPAGDVEAAYLAALGTAASYTATADTLTIFDADGAAILTYGVAAAEPLEGTVWHAIAINNGRGAVESVVEGTDPTATYDAAGTVSGNASCNQFSGPAVVDGSAIAIGPLASTKMACADEAANAQESAFLAALEASTTFDVRNSRLELRDAEGALQVQFEAE